MPVLPKYQLKELFESGDLITQTTLDELIDATYNELLVAGSNVTLNRVTTPSGTTVTINSTGGGGGAQGAQGAQGASGSAGLFKVRDQFVQNGVNLQVKDGVATESKKTAVKIILKAPS
jgi:hypothetical protein